MGLGERRSGRIRVRLGCFGLPQATDWPRYRDGVPYSPVMPEALPWAPSVGTGASCNLRKQVTGFSLAAVGLQPSTAWHMTWSVLGSMGAYHRWESSPDRGVGAMTHLGCATRWCDWWAPVAHPGEVVSGGALVNHCVRCRLR